MTAKTRLSFVIPARNEETSLPETLNSIHSSAKQVGELYEVVVVNDASTDRTRDVALAHDARVIDVHLRKISAVRNAGAKAAVGDVLIFVDADTLINKPVLCAALSALERGAIGGGARVRLDKLTPVVPRILGNAFALGWFSAGWAAGCFVFVQRSAFDTVGGFDERYFASEEMHLSRALKRQGRFKVVWPAVVSSGRKARMYSAKEMLRMLPKMVWRGVKGWQQREGNEYWYEDRRESKPGLAPTHSDASL